MSDLILKADEFDKQAAKWRKGRTIEDLRHTHILMPKYDGCHLIVDTTLREALSREGKLVLSCDHIIDECVRLFGPGYMIQGEAWQSLTPFPEISGAYRRHTPQPQLIFVAYDMLSDNEWEEMDPAAGYALRYCRLQPASGAQGYVRRVPIIADSHVGHHGGVMALARYYVSLGGYDGLIARDPNAGFYRGRSRDGAIVKIKPTLSFDLRCCGLEEVKGEKTGRPVYKALVLYRGRPVMVGSGMPHSRVDCPEPGQIIEVECMGITPDGSLREPRFKAIRYDKTKPDA